MPLQKHELFSRSKCPNWLPWGHSPGHPGRTPLGDRRSPSPGYSNHLGQRRREQLPVSWWAVQGPGRAAASSLRAPLSSEGERVKSHPAPGERSRGAGESQASGDQSSGLPPRPGDSRRTPGLPRAVYPACVDSCEPSGEVPRRPRRPESCVWEPGTAGARSASSGWSSRGAGPLATLPGSPRCLAKASGTRCPGRRGPKRPYPPQAAPPPCQGRSKQETQDLTWRDPDFWPGFPLSR